MHPLPPPDVRRPVDAACHVHDTGAMSQEQDPSARIAALFDGIAEVYDQSGAVFFATIAGGLVERLTPASGQRALDLGCGRGAVTFPLADAVGPTGRVDAVDLAPAMVRLTGEEAASRGLAQVRVGVADVSSPEECPLVEAGAYDVVVSSLVLFFLPDPAAALRRWRPLLAGGGRLGFSTFRPWTPAWRAVEGIFTDYIDVAAQASTAMPQVFQDDATVDDLVRAAGFTDVRSEAVTYAIGFADVEQWRRWSMGTGMRALWAGTPPEAHDEILARVGALLAERPGPDGRPSLDVDVRYTFGRG